MSKGNTTEADIIAYIFNATAMPNYGSGGGTILHVSLHTSDPGEAGSQTTNEATYGSYARVAVNRNAGGWTCSANQASNTAAVTFPTCTSGSNTITHVAVGTAASGAGQILYSGALTGSLAVSAGITPEFAIGLLTITED